MTNYYYKQSNLCITTTSPQIKFGRSDKKSLSKDSPSHDHKRVAKISFLKKSQHTFRTKLTTIEQTQLSMASGPNWYQIGKETCFIPKVSKFYVEKGY